MPRRRTRQPLVALVVDIYEQGNDEYPVVRHEFIGRTPEEAKGYFHAHTETDVFLAGCLKGHFKDFACRAEMHWRTLR